MPLFQESIVKKHLSTIDESVIESAYLEYKRVYSPEKIKNIQVAKEEQYQEGFIKDVFGSVLGYSVYPEHPYNIETEKKNETNAKKADGAILKDEKVVGVIELKDNKTKNLEAVKDQAFGYKHNHKECSYVISSNFHKLRFYIDDATDYEEFDLYNLDKETFKRFFMYLRKEGLLDKNLPKLLREETKFHEEEISKKLYKDYSDFKRSFYENAVKNNPENDKLILFKKSQKFLDRILFLLFAEDKGLVGTNSIVNIVEKWSGADDDYYQPLYEMVNKYFGHLYRGYTYQKTGEVIPQFGGELFAPDDVLEILKIDDEVLKNNLLILSKYDFNTDVDVNILGHIFEHSLNEVDDVEAELRGEQLDKTKSKRKKDGVFYTPKYITKYIVDNTLGKLCSEKKAELKLDQDIAIFEYQKADGKLNEKGKDLYERLDAYKAWLLTLKVCDPACGSGAFLNQALSFFIEEHKFVDDIIAELTNTPLRLFDTDLQILENNIFGVDINEESIEIAKLSLWLRTAQPGRKLSDLSNNIKCGNSLIDDPDVAGDKAFNWQIEFPAVFNMGGFDVVIGNPPYGAQFSESEVIYFNKHFVHQSYQLDSYLLFTEKLKQWIKYGGFAGYIMPNTWLSSLFGSKIRQFVFGKFQIVDLVHYSYFVFDDATVEADTYIFKNEVPSAPNLFPLTTINRDKTEIKKFVQQLEWIKEEGKPINIYQSEESNLLRKKFSTLKKLGDIVEIVQGTKPFQKGKGKPAQTEETMKDQPFVSVVKKDETFKPLLRGSLINKYANYWNENYWISYGDWLAEPRYTAKFDCPEKLLIRQTGDSLIATYDDKQFIARDNLYVIRDDNGVINLKALLAILNSKLLTWYFQNVINPERGKAMAQVKRGHLQELPIQIKGMDTLIIHSEKRLQLTAESIKLSFKFLKFLSSQFSEELSSKMSSWEDLEFKDFITELNKAIKKSDGQPLTKLHEMEWMEVFESKKGEVIELRSEIVKTDKEIDRMVYELYGLTEEEIQIVENS